MPTINRAVILAAGRGTRMGSLTETIPKPMLAIGGQPMLERILENLTLAGIQHFLIVVGYQHQAIESYFAGSTFDIQFLLQNPVNGTGAAALLAQEFTEDSPFLLTFGDIMVGIDEYARAMQTMDDQADGVLAVKAVDDPWQGAAVYVEGDRITRIIEKPPQGSSTTHWNSAGLYCFRPLVFRYLADLKPSIRNEYELTAAIDDMLADGLQLRISAIQGEWRDVGRPEDLAAINSKPAG